MPDITIRLATADDIETMIHHRCAMFAEMEWGDEASRALMNADFRGWALEHLQNGTFWTWLACDGEMVVSGAGIYHLDWPAGPTQNSYPRAYIYNVYTEPAYRRQGIARRLMEHALADMRARGIRTVGLHASDFGRRMYEQLGFEATNEMQLVLPR
jgi:ribosomal protein S18 acetylase RimI-like enzyme